MHIRVDGPARIFVGPVDCTFMGQQGGSELGITENGVQVSINQLTHRVNSDDMGGAEGNPADILIMGTSATIRGVIVKYPNNLQTIGQVFNGLAYMGEGWTVLPGTPLFAGGFGFSLWLLGYTTFFYFPKCELASQPREFNISTTERKTSFAFTAQPLHLPWGSALYASGNAKYFSPPVHCANGAYGYYGHGGSVSAMMKTTSSGTGSSTQSYQKYTASKVFDAYNGKYANTDKLYSLSGTGAIDAGVIDSIGQGLSALMTQSN